MAKKKEEEAAVKTTCAVDALIVKQEENQHKLASAGRVYNPKTGKLAFPSEIRKKG